METEKTERWGAYYPDAFENGMPPFHVFSSHKEAREYVRECNRDVEDDADKVRCAHYVGTLPDGPVGKPDTFAVWCASAGCLPDGDCPEFVGTFLDCVNYAAEGNLTLHNENPRTLYRYFVEPYAGDDA